MSIKRMSAVWDQSQHKGSELLLMLALADSADDLGVCWPGYNYLAQKIRMGRDSAIRLVAACEESGELWKLNRAKQRSNVYIVTVGLTPEVLEVACEKALSLGALYTTGSRILRPPPQVLAVVGSSDHLTGEKGHVVGTSDQVVGPVLPGSRTAILPDPSLSVITQEERDLWQTVLVHLAGQLDPATFDRCLRGTVASRVDGLLTVTAPERALPWLERLRPTVARAVAHAAGEELAVEFVARGEAV